MTDAELMAGMRARKDAGSKLAADRIEQLAVTNEQLVATNEALTKERDDFENLWSHSDFNLKLKTKELKAAKAVVKKAVKLMSKLYDLERTHEMSDFIVEHGEQNGAFD